MLFICESINLFINLLLKGIERNPQPKINSPQVNLRQLKLLIYDNGAKKMIHVLEIRTRRNEKILIECCLVVDQMTQITDAKNNFSVASYQGILFPSQLS